MLTYNKKRNMIKRILKTSSLFYLLLLPSMMVACSDSSDNNTGDFSPSIVDPVNVANQNIERAMHLTDNTLSLYFDEDGMAMSRYYNPYKETKSDERGSVWMYTSSIEAVNAILSALTAHKELGDATYYDKNYARYTSTLDKLYGGLEYYMGTYSLTSYTQTKSWSVYGVHRANSIGNANVSGIENVYDDQMWLIRELLHSYKLTNKQEYLTKAEYLTEYVLDGWDTTIDENGNENGGITWGPGYVTKHACSNGPLVSSLVWLHDLYKGKNVDIEYRYIDSSDKQTRKSETRKKDQYYLDYAKKVYNWQKDLLMMSEGVYYDMRGGCDPNCDVVYETVGGVKYRKNTALTRSEGQAYSYNSGTMLSGSADLYRATNENIFLEDGKKLSDDAFNYFAKKGVDVIGYYSYDTAGFNNWFNGILMRGFVDMHSDYGKTKEYINTFQQNLDYAYTNYLYKGLLPTDLLKGWQASEKDNDGVEGMFNFSYAAEYAILSEFQLVNKPK